MSFETSSTKRHPVSEMMGFGYRPGLSEGSLKLPLFQTSTFVFNNAAEGKQFFELAYGLRDPEDGEELGLIYSRLNNPNNEVLEGRLCLWEEAEMGLTFVSGMAAITTTVLAHARPGDVVAFSEPIYGGTDHLLRSILPEFGVSVIGFSHETTEEALATRIEAAAGERLAMVYLETPANPTNALFDVSMARRVADRFATDDHRPLVAVDNTFLGPIWQHPLAHGADVSLYSATKHLGGHSDLIAGAAVGSAEALGPVAAMRTFMGTTLDPHTAWLLTRSLETLSLRMHHATENAGRVADLLNDSSVPQSVSYLGLLREGDDGYDLYHKQCLGPGSMVAVVFASEAEAFAFIDALDMISLAVSLGGTESLVEHPASMTHAGVDPETRAAHGVTEGLVRLSIGVEHIDDLLADVEGALRTVSSL